MDMIAKPDLTREEWALVAELLRNELTELPAEIHHTDSRNYRDTLHVRRETLVHALTKVEIILAE